MENSKDRTDQSETNEMLDYKPICCDNLHPFTAHKIRKAEEFLRDILGEGEHVQNKRGK